VRVGYGRGYYGDGQLAPKNPRRGFGWGKLAIVVGVGAAVWLMWPRKPKYDVGTGHGGDESKPPASLPPDFRVEQQQAQQLPLPASQQPPLPQQLPLPASQHPPLPQQQPPQIAQIADERGYPSQQAYEDAVVASARQLQASGAKIVLAPHLAHLAPRLERA
jgi:hypothetical protein